MTGNQKNNNKKIKKRKKRNYVNYKFLFFFSNKYFFSRLAYHYIISFWSLTYIYIFVPK